MYLILIEADKIYCGWYTLLAQMIYNKDYHFKLHFVAVEI